MEGDEIKVPVIHVQTGGEGGGELHRTASPVDDPGAAADGVQFLIGGVVQVDLKLQRLVCADQFQGGAVLLSTPGGGQARQGRLAGVDGVGAVGQIAGPEALLRLHAQAALPVVSQAAAGVFRGQITQEVQLIAVILEGRSGRIQPQQMTHGGIRDPAAIVHMPQESGLVCKGDQVGGARGVQTECPLLLVKRNTHKTVLPYCRVMVFGVLLPNHTRFVPVCQC